MSSKYCLCPEYTLCSLSIVYVLRVQFFSESTFNVHRVQFLSPEYSLCPQSTVYVLRVQFMSLDYSICPQSPVLFREYI